MLGLPDAITACLFDLDGVLTKTATVHAKAWKEMFDSYLKERDGDGFTPFDLHHDYDEYVDGKPREDGVRDFLKSRDVDADDALVKRLGDQKNDLVQQVIERDGVEVYEGSVDYARRAKEAGLKLAVVSSSANAKPVLQSVGILDLFDTVVDGHAVAEDGLKGKPAPDTFLEGAKRLGAEPAAAAVFEDALAGVEAGRAGDFGFVVGVNRVGQAEALQRHGATVVVDDLSDLA